MFYSYCASGIGTMSFGYDEEKLAPERPPLGYSYRPLPLLRLEMLPILLLPLCYSSCAATTSCRCLDEESRLWALLPPMELMNG